MNNAQWNYVSFFLIVTCDHIISHSKQIYIFSIQCSTGLNHCAKNPDFARAWVLKNFNNLQLHHLYSMHKKTVFETSCDMVRNLWLNFLAICQKQNYEEWNFLWHVCMYVWGVCVYVCMYVCMYVSVCIYVRMYLCMYECMHVERNWNLRRSDKNDRLWCQGERDRGPILIFEILKTEEGIPSQIKRHIIRRTGRHVQPDKRWRVVLLLLGNVRGESHHELYRRWKLHFCVYVWWKNQQKTVCFLNISSPCSHLLILHKIMNNDHVLGFHNKSGQGQGQ